MKRAPQQGIIGIMWIRFHHEMQMDMYHWSIQPRRASRFIRAAVDDGARDADLSNHRDHHQSIAQTVYFTETYFQTSMFHTAYFQTSTPLLHGRVREQTDSPMEPENNSFSADQPTWTSQVSTHYIVMINIWLRIISIVTTWFLLGLENLEKWEGISH